MTDAPTPTSSNASGRRRRSAPWWVASAAALVAVVAAAFVVVPRVTGDEPQARAADITNWEGACQNNLTNGDTRRGAGGWWLNCDAMEAYAGKSPNGSPVCILLRMRGLFISDGDLVDVDAIRWDQFRGWNTQGGREAAGPEGRTNRMAQTKAAGAIIGVKADGSNKFDHQYGSDVDRQPGTTRPCKGPNP